MRPKLALKNSDNFEIDIVYCVVSVQSWCFFSNNRLNCSGLQAKIERDNRFSVIRGGEARDVVVEELVVGDIGRVKYGERRLLNYSSVGFSTGDVS